MVSGDGWGWGKGNVGTVGDEDGVVWGRLGMGIEVCGDGCGWIQSLWGWMGMGTKVRPHAVSILDPLGSLSQQGTLQSAVNHYRTMTNISIIRHC